ncbi:MAG: NUDIX hydrolase [Lyngbya sp. HA4199-MV5]|jgi:ADP-ribose pyrophosphatase YjhB (NUDIX family)|nr:NUDIX hydrolase [Lyngbya sp. HA4199-MV5]
MPNVPHFQEAGRMNPVSPDDRMPEATYSTALDFLVFACVDLVFTHQHQILLAKRNTEPRSSWWLVGGRMVAGEAPTDTAKRKAQQEAQLDNLNADRFQYIGVYSTCFATRRQAPQHHGSHSLNVTYQIELTAEEREQVNLRSDEYDTWQWIDLEDVSSLLKLDDAMDQALLRVVSDV